MKETLNKAASNEEKQKKATLENAKKAMKEKLDKQVQAEKEAKIATEKAQKDEENRMLALPGQYGNIALLSEDDDETAGGGFLKRHDDKISAAEKVIRDKEEA